YLSLDPEAIRLDLSALETICLRDLALALLEDFAVVLVGFVTVSERGDLLGFVRGRVQRDYEITIDVTPGTAAVQFDLSSGEVVFQRLRARNPVFVFDDLTHGGSPNRPCHTVERVYTRRRGAGDGPVIREACPCSRSRNLCSMV